MVGLFLFFWPVVLVGVNEVAAEDFSGVPVGDRCVCLFDKDERGCSAVAASEPEVVELACVSEGEFAVPVNDVEMNRPGFDGGSLSSRG